MKLVNRVLLLLDQLNWRRQTRFLRSESSPPTSGIVLFCDLMSMIATAKVETLFARMLQLRGYRTVELPSVVPPERRRPLASAMA